MGIQCCLHILVEINDHKKRTMNLHHSPSLSFPPYTPTVPSCSFVFSAVDHGPCATLRLIPSCVFYPSNHLPIPSLEAQGWIIAHSRKAGPSQFTHTVWNMNILCKKEICGSQFHLLAGVLWDVQRWQRLLCWTSQETGMLWHLSNITSAKLQFCYHVKDLTCAVLFYNYFCLDKRLLKLLNDFFSKLCCTIEELHWLAVTQWSLRVSSSIFSSVTASISSTSISMPPVSDSVWANTVKGHLTCIILGLFHGWMCNAIFLT